MVTRRSRYLEVNLKSIILHLLAIVAAVSVEAAESNFLTPEELNVISRADEIQKDYSQRGFNIVQIISLDKAIVSDRVKDFILYADFSGKVDDDIFVATVKENGPESYETVTGAKRTLMSYVAISKKEIDILARSKPLIAKKAMAEKELYRQAGERSFQENCTNMKVLFDDLDLFVSDIQVDSTSAYSDTVQQLLKKRQALREAIFRKEYHGSAITEQTLADQKTELNLLAVSIAREKADREKDKEVQKARLAEEAAKQKVEEAAQKARLEAQAVEEASRENALFQQWRLKFLSYAYLSEELPDEKLMFGFDDSKYVELQARLGIFFRDLKYRPTKINGIKDVPEEASTEKIEYVLNQLKNKYPREYLSAEKKAQEAIDKKAQAVAGKEGG